MASPFASRRPASAGPAAQRNHGWRAGGAPLVAFTDDDCRPAPGWLEALLAGGGVTARRSRAGPRSTRTSDTCSRLARTVEVERPERRGTSPATSPIRARSCRTGRRLRRRVRLAVGRGHRPRPAGRRGRGHGCVTHPQALVRHAVIATHAAPGADGGPPPGVAAAGDRPPSGATRGALPRAGSPTAPTPRSRRESSLRRWLAAAARPPRSPSARFPFSRTTSTTTVAAAWAAPADSPASRPACRRAWRSTWSSSPSALRGSARHRALVI